MQQESLSTYLNSVQGVQRMERVSSASGPVSFARIYSGLNETLRRGGHYKNGACVIHLDLNHPDAEEFVDATRQELPWVKKCLDVTPEWWNESSELLRTKILRGIQSGDIWLSKVKHDQNGQRIYSTYVLRSTSQAEAPACSNTSTLVTVRLTGLSPLSLKVCPTCAASIQRQVSEQLESTSPLRKISKWALESLGLPTFYGVKVSATQHSEKL